MAILNTPRAGRDHDGYMENLIYNMYNDENVFYKSGCGICGLGPQDIVNCFNAIRKIFAKINIFIFRKIVKQRLIFFMSQKKLFDLLIG